MSDQFVLKVMENNRNEAYIKSETYRFRMLNDRLDIPTLTVLLDAYQAEVGMIARLDIQIHEATRVTHLTGIIS